MPIEMRSPRTLHEWEAYFDFRWRLLRAPWRQPRGSEKDSFEQTAHHLMALADNVELIGIGRIHGCRAHKAQIRYLAVREDQRRQGVGSAIIARLEEIAAATGAEEIVISAREPVVVFYERLGYTVIGLGPTLFGEIAHKKMSKRLEGRRHP